MNCIRKRVHLDTYGSKDVVSENVVHTSPLHFSPKMYYNSLTANCSIVFLYVRRWNIYIFQRRERNMDQGITLMAGSLCNTLEYVEKIFHEHKNVLKSIELYINDFNVNREKINDITDARWKKIIENQRKKAEADGQKTILDQDQLFSLSDQIVSDISYITLTTESCQFFKRRWIDTGNIRRLKDLIDCYSKSWKRFNGIYSNIDCLIRQPMFLKYVRSTEERRQEFWGLVNEFCNQIEKIDHVLVEAFQNDLKNKRMLLAEQRYQEFLNYETDGSLIEDAEELQAQELENEQLFSGCKIKYIPLEHIAATFEEVSKLPDLTSNSNLKQLTNLLIAL